MPSKLEQLQLQFRQRLMQEKEERMIKIHTENQQKALSKVTKYTGLYSSQATKPQPHHSPVKKGSPGVDRSRPLPPISKDLPRSRNTSDVARNDHHSSSSGDSSPTDAFSKPISKYSSYRMNKTAEVGRNGYQQSSYPGNLYSSVSATSESLSNKVQDLVKNGHQQGGYSSNRDSPNSAPSESTTRTMLISSRSRSVDLDHRLSGKTVLQTGRPASRNGYSRPTNHEIKSVRQNPSQDLRVDQKKHTEFQISKSNSKGREDSLHKGSQNGPVSRLQESKRPARSPPSTTAIVTNQRQKVQPPARKPSVVKPSSRPPASSSGQQVSRKPPGPGQSQCPVCGRNFNQDRIEKHSAVCKKATQKKVKVFDATKMRTKGTEAEQFIRKGLHKVETKQVKKGDWRKKHGDFIEAIRQAKMVQQHLAKGGKVSDLPPPPPSDTSDYVPCPHCGRKFSEGVAERHIPKCKNILSNKKNPNVPSRRK